MKKNIIKIGILYILLIVAAFYMQTNQSILNGNEITRNSEGEGSRQVDLVLNSKGLEDYDYQLTIDELIPNESMAEELFEKAKKEIDKSFCNYGESIDSVVSKVNMSDSYVGGIVSAEWTLSDYTYVDASGSVNQDLIYKLNQDELKENTLITAQVRLECGNYNTEYVFNFKIVPEKLSKEENLVKAIDQEMEKQLEQEGTKTVYLPDEVNGEKITWREKKENLVIKVIILEIVITFLLYYSGREKKKEDIKQRKNKMQMDYPEIVSKMAILMGAGMTIEQEWNKITARYIEKRNKKQIKETPIYESMLVTQREIRDGESPRKAYSRFAKNTDLGCYQRFVRILHQSIQKGNKGVLIMLEKESDDAFKERRLMAKRLGEEASTKMLMPLLLMMGVVIAIVMAPAIISFNG